MADSGPRRDMRFNVRPEGGLVAISFTNREHPHQNSHLYSAECRLEPGLARELGESLQAAAARAEAAHS